MNLVTAITGLVRRSLENPSTPLSAPDDWLYDALGSYKASSGVNVNHNTALTYPPLWRGVNLISGDVGRSPLLTYQRKGSGLELALKHPLYRLLRREPNAEITAFIFWQSLMGHVLLQGNGYAYIVRRGDGRPLELVPLSPLRTYPVRANGQLWYVLEDKSGRPDRKLPAEDVLHLKGLCFDGLVGYNVIQKARETVGLGLAMQTHGSIFFRNSARAAVVLKHPGKLTPEARKNLRESWERLHAGLENSHRTAILEEGMDAQAMTVNAKDAQFLEGRQFSIVEIANFLGVPSHKLGDKSNASYNSLEQENNSYLGETLERWFTMIESEIWCKILTEEEKAEESIVCRFDRSALVIASMNDRANYYSKALASGWMNDDEVRAKEGLNPIPDGEGETFFRPSSVIPLGEEPPTPAPQLPPKDDKDPPSDDNQDEPAKDNPQRAALLDAHRSILLDAGRRAARRLEVAAAKAAKKPGEFIRQLEDLEREHRTTLIEILTPALRAAAATPGAIATGPVEAACTLLTDTRSGLLKVAGQATAKDLAERVQAWSTRRGQEWPTTFVDTVLPPPKAA